MAPQQHALVLFNRNFCEEQLARFSPVTHGIVQGESIFVAFFLHCKSSPPPPFPLSHLGRGEQGGQVIHPARELGSLPSPSAREHVRVAFRLQEVHLAHLMT